MFISITKGKKYTSSFIQYKSHNKSLIHIERIARIYLNQANLFKLSNFIVI